MKSNCESCVYFDYDEFYGEEVCRADLDEDESVTLCLNGQISARFTDSTTNIKAFRSRTKLLNAL